MPDYKVLLINKIIVYDKYINYICHIFCLTFNKVIMVVKLKKLAEEAIVPTYANPGDAGMDLVAVSYKYDAVHDNHVYGTGIAIEIPEGYVGLVFPRSSNRRTKAYLTNSVGVIDSGYRGEITFSFKNRSVQNNVKPYLIGERVGQIIILPYPMIDFVEVEELSKTERGEGGHGSTGK